MTKQKDMYYLMFVCEV